MALWESVGQSSSARPSHPWLTAAVSALDVQLRRRHAVLEYTQHRSCIFRLEIERSHFPIILKDGTRLRAGQRLGRLHFWNEHVPLVPKAGATIAWARQMQQGIVISLRELARYLMSRPDLCDIAVICADVPSGTKSQIDQVGRIMAHFGFEAIAEREPLSIGEGLHRFAENVLISLVVFARNARALRFDSLSRVRLPIYISRRALEERFGAAAKLTGKHHDLF